MHLHIFQNYSENPGIGNTELISCPSIIISEKFIILRNAWILKEKMRLMIFNIDDYSKPMIKGLENVTRLVFLLIGFFKQEQFLWTTGHRYYIPATLHFHFFL